MSRDHYATPQLLHRDFLSNHAVGLQHFTHFGKRNANKVSCQSGGSVHDKVGIDGDRKVSKETGGDVDPLPDVLTRCQAHSSMFV